MLSTLRQWLMGRTKRTSGGRPRRWMQVESLESRRVFHLGDLDPVFGAAGITQTPFTTNLSSFDEPADIAVQADDRIVEVGRVDAGESRLLGITRFLANGSLDTSFGSGGKILESFHSSFGSSGRVTIQSDQKIVVAVEGEYGHVIVVRYDSTGQRDASFGANGVVDYYLGTGFVVGDVAIQSDQQIVVVGAIGSGVASGYLTYDTLALRLQTTGAMDVSFGAGGVAQFSWHDFRETAQHVVPRTDGTLIISGTAHDLQDQREIFVGRLDSHGNADSTFGGTGILKIPYGKVPIFAESADVSVVVQSSGRLILSATREEQFGQDQFNLVAVTSSGSIDTMFGSDGILATPIVGRTDPQVRGLVQRPDGRLLAVGASRSTFEELLLVQYQADGALDTTWRQTGISTLFSVTGVTGVVLQSNGRAVVAWRGRDIHGTNDFAVLGVGSSGLLDPTFGAAGRQQVNFVSPYSSAKATQLAVQGDGKITLAGSCQTDDDLPWCVSRYKPDGTLDPSFGTGGKLTGGRKYLGDMPLLLLDAENRLLLIEQSNNINVIHLERFDRDGNVDLTWGNQGVRDVDVGVNYLYALQAIMQGDGKILVAALTQVGGSPLQARLFRLNADGSLDLAFGSQGSVTLFDEQENLSLCTLLVQSDGRIIATSARGFGQSPEIVMTRFTSTGSLDATWGSGGSSSIAAGQGYVYCSTGVFLANGDVLHSCIMIDNSQAFIRVNSIGQPVTSFGQQGIVQDAGVTAAYKGIITSMVPLSPGGWAAVGWGLGLSAPDREQTLVQFFGDDGALDANAADGGVRWVATGLTPNQAYAAAMGPDGNLFVAGRVTELVDSNFLMAKITAGGGVYRPWHNASQPLNVNGDPQNQIAPIDALLVINELNGPGPRLLAPPLANVQPHAFVDVNQDGFVSAVDALLVINHLNGVVGAEGEAIAADAVFAESATAPFSWWTGLMPAATEARPLAPPSFDLKRHFDADLDFDGAGSERAGRLIGFGLARHGRNKIAVPKRIPSPGLDGFRDAEWASEFRAE